MSLIDELAQQGITQEDLEKAASVRLFAADAAAEGIDLSQYDESTVEGLYEHWLNLRADEAGEVKQASFEDEAREEARAKLAEAEYIGRYMARVYVDELEKQAGAREMGATAAKKARELAGHIPGVGDISRGASKLRGAHAAHKAGRAAAEFGEKHRGKKYVGGAMGAAADKVKGGADMVRNALGKSGLKDVAKGGGKMVGTAGLIGLAAKGAVGEKRGSGLSDFDELVAARIDEILGNDTVTLEDAVDAAALEVLEAHGYTFE